MSKLYLIDGNSLVYRAFYAIPKLTTKEGKPTNAIYGFVIMLLKVLKEEKPDYLAIFFDSKAPTFRHSFFPEYKAFRKKMPDEMIIQIPIIYEVIENLGCFYFSLDGYEADDLIASSVKRFKDSLDFIFILTQDKDLFSLVDEKIRVISGKGLTEKNIFDEERVIEKFNVPPPSLLELFSLIGDKIDNIPGAKGIGEKTAISLIKKYGNIENLLKNLEEIDQGLKKIIMKEREGIELSKKLVMLKDDIPFPFSLLDLKIKEINKEKLFSLFSSLEFKRLIKELSLESAS